MDNSPSPRDRTRRGFISDIAVGAGGVIAASSLLPTVASAAGSASPVAAEFDLTWVDRLTAKHKAVFDSPDINEGTVFTNATVFMMSFQDVYGLKDPDTQPVIVLRHHGVVLAFNDSIWEKYGIGTELKLTNAEKRNPYTKELATLKDRGATILVCNLAANRQAGAIAKRVGADTATVRADIYANFVPGSILQHSGVFATIRAQQAGCAFMKSA